MKISKKLALFALLGLISVDLCANDDPKDKTTKKAADVLKKVADKPADKKADKKDDAKKKADGKDDKKSPAKDLKKSADAKEKGKEDKKVEKDEDVVMDKVLGDVFEIASKAIIEKAIALCEDKKCETVEEVQEAVAKDNKLKGAFVESTKYGMRVPVVIKAVKGAGDAISPKEFDELKEKMINTRKKETAEVFKKAIAPEKKKEEKDKKAKADADADDVKKKADSADDKKKKAGDKVSAKKK